MNYKNLFKFPFSLLVHISTLSFFFLAETCLCADKHFNTCNPFNCGNGPDISYPFWVPNRQDSYCGYPGFMVSCKDGRPIFNMSGDDYIIHEIFHKNQSILVSNTQASDQNCPPLIHNITLPHTLFEFGPAHVNLFLFFHCIKQLPNEYLSHQIDCNTDGTTRRSLAFFGDAPILKNATSLVRGCKTSLIVPADQSGDVSEATIDRNYTEMLRKGFLLNWKATNCTECKESGGSCGFNITTYKFACFCHDRPHLRSCPGAGKNTRRKLIIGFSAAAMGIILASIFFCLKRKVLSEKLMVFRKKEMKNKNVEAFLMNYGSLFPKRYRYSDVKKITKSFKHKLGQGGFGGVYKGKLFDGCLVAVKLLNESKGDGEDFINEVASITRTSHVNVITLLGFCFEGSKRALIYEFMRNGSLEKLIYDDKPTENRRLGWETLYKIAIGIARGLEYLHQGCNTHILHFDIKPHNILLDEDFCPKISDFGLAKQCTKKKSIIPMLGTRGTVGYIAPEVFSRTFGEVSDKSDVYSYGMMVLEMVGGKRNIVVGSGETSEIYFPHRIYKNLHLPGHLGLIGISTKDDEEIARKMILVGLWCIQTNPSDRPSMSKVQEMLEGSLESLQIPPKPFLSSPSRLLSMNLHDHEGTEASKKIAVDPPHSLWSVL